MLGKFGGRTRARTWDPLIKSRRSSFDLIIYFFKPNTKARLSDQKLIAVFQTASLWRELAYRNRSCRLRDQLRNAYMEQHGALTFVVVAGPILSHAPTSLKHSDAQGLA
jgi:hypothetical protein